MKQVLLSVFFGLFTISAAADEVTPDLAETVIIDGTTVDLNEFVWKNRPLIVFADSPNDPRYTQQLAFLNDQVEELHTRDVIVLTDADPAANSALREQLRPRGFMIVLLAKDGTIYLRKPSPWDVREISRVIDKLPLRQQEMRDRR